MSYGPRRWTVLLTVMGFFGLAVAPAQAQESRSSHSRSMAEALAQGRGLYLASCANCHGADGTGLNAGQVGLPLDPPDFTHSAFASREPKADWAGVVTLGGPLRGFDQLMPAFGDALSREDIETTYNISRRINAEEELLANADLVITSTRNEIESQYGLYDYYDPACMTVIPPGTNLVRYHPHYKP